VLADRASARVAVNALSTLSAVGDKVAIPLDRGIDTRETSSARRAFARARHTAKTNAPCRSKSVRGRDTARSATVTTIARA